MTRTSLPGWGLVLGGGGSVGTAYIAGVLRALDDCGLAPSSAGLVVGTSAGAVAAAMVRTGSDADAILATSEVEGDRGQFYEAAWTSTAGLVRRGIGAASTVARSWSKLPLPRVPYTDAMFPGGLYRVRDETQLTSVVPASWPDRPLWLMAVDLFTGRRVALGSRPRHRTVPLTEAVLASCAVPGFYEPRLIAGRRYVDGGVRSSTHLDLAVGAGLRTIVCVAPFAYDPRTGPRPSAGHRVLRGPAVRRLRKELPTGEWTDVLVLQPSVGDLGLHGTNFLRPRGNGPVHDRAYDQARALFDSAAAARFLGTARTDVQTDTHTEAREGAPA